MGKPIPYKSCIKPLKFVGNRLACSAKQRFVRNIEKRSVYHVS